MKAWRSPATSSLARRIAPCMPSSSGVRSTSAPRASMMVTFSWEKFSGTNSFTLYPRFTPINASPIPVLPAVASTMVPPGASLPCCSARRMIPMAARSFTLPPGFKYSSLAKMSAEPAGTRRLSRRTGVPPTRSVMSSATPRWETSGFFRCTLQGKGRDGNRQWNRSQVFEIPRTSRGDDGFLFRARGCRLGACVVAALGSDGEFAVSFGFGLNPDRAEAAAGSGIGWLVADRVLIADVVRHLPADLIHLVESAGEKGEASGSLRYDLERPARALGMLFVAENSDRIH